KGPVARRHFLHVLSEGAPKPFQQGSGRLELAEAITSPHNPLTARVLVNRVWALNFGRPLVATPSNFGALGERPTHPELLDDLAVRFLEAGWSLKWLQREMVLSAAYRQSSEPLTPTRSPQGRGQVAPTLSPGGRGQGEGVRAADPENRLLGRMNRRRLSVEAWRDALLCAAGQLDHTIGGASLGPPCPQGRRVPVY